VEERALATFLTARFSAIDRYCKLAILRASRRLSTPVLFSQKLSTSIVQLVGSRKLPEAIKSSRKMMDPPSVLYRYRIIENGNFYIEDSSGLSELSWQLNNADFHVSIQSIDRMDIGKDMVVCIDVDGRKKPFDATGHYPIFVQIGRSSKGDPEPFYVARVKRHGRLGSYDSELLYTQVTDGTSSATCILKPYSAYGKMFRTAKFQVLVLRHDPIDHPPTCSVEGAIDPTGPFFWKNIYQAGDEESLEMALERELSRTYHGEGESDAGSDDSDSEGGQECYYSPEESDGELDDELGEEREVDGLPHSHGVHDDSDTEELEETEDSQSREEVDFEKGPGDNVASVKLLREELRRAREEISVLKAENEGLRAHGFVV